MDKAYEAKQHEDAIREAWQNARIFEAPSPEKTRTGKSFTIPLPPPNVTGQLHLGHAAMLVVEDIMCRYHRMKGDAVLWLPGTDHAAIATETVVLKHLGITHRDEEISREKFLEEAWKWSAKSHDTIVEQIKKMGASCDWTRERFTMDFGLSNAVNTIFADLYNAGLIYRGKRMINWSVGAQSVLSDDELIWEERDETLYYIQCGEFVISTVRPETKCADSPVVVNPEAMYVRIRNNAGQSLIISEIQWEKAKTFDDSFSKKICELWPSIQKIAGQRISSEDIEQIWTEAKGRSQNEEMLKNKLQEASNWDNQRKIIQQISDTEKSERQNLQAELKNPYANAEGFTNFRDYEEVERIQGTDLQNIAFEFETYAGKRKFFVLADGYIDPEFGTGAMTISAAHDAHDFEIAQRHHLPFPQKIDFQGKMTEIAGPCAGMTVIEARKKSVEIMKEKGLIVKEEPYHHSVPLCYRTGTVVEPMISKQWFIDVNKEFFHPVLQQTTTLKKLTADAVRNGDVKIVPQRFEKIYFQWIDNLRDWCISRQIWWGHRIPVWYSNEVEKSKACPGDEPPQAESRPGSEGQKEEEEIHLMQKQNLIFVRHGECGVNAEQRVASRNDSPLTEQGKEQARNLADVLQKEKKVQKIIASPLLRAKETAEIVAEILGLEVEIWDELIEVDVGKFAGTPIADYENYSVFEPMAREKSGESMKELAERAAKIWAKIGELKPVDGEVAIFGHGLFTAVLFAVRDGVAPENFAAYEKRWAMENCKTHGMTLMISPKEENLVQDPDTLDTWFSSALWPFSTLGWPDTEHPDFKNFFPTSVLETGHDILFFWVARMIMFSSFATGKVPFHTVYLHGLVCDEKGQKMSKSKGNGIDPLAMIGKFGTDALRMSMIVGTTPGNPINLGEKKVEGYRNFANKLWNVARFILSQTTSENSEAITAQTITERWLLSRTEKLVEEVTQGIEKYRFGEIGQLLYEFTWNELADWGIEASKADPSPKTALILRTVLKTLLKLLHPYTPFVTEKIWAETGEENLLAIAPWPQERPEWRDEKVEQDFSFLQEIITTIRSLRSANKVDPAKHIPVHFIGKNLDLLQQHEKILTTLARLEEISYASPAGEGVTGFVGETEIFLPLSGFVDMAAEEERLQKELIETEKLLDTLKVRLGNKEYVKNAPEKLVGESRRQQGELQQKLEKLQKQLQKYSGNS